MTWLRARPTQAREPCQLPNELGHKPGAIWVCDECGKRWVLAREPGSDYFRVWVPRLLPWPRARRPKGGWPGHRLLVS